MRIVYLITRSDAIGGAHIHVRDLSQKMMGEHDVTVMVGGEGPFTEQLRERSVPYVSLKNLVRAIHPVKDAKAVFELGRRMRELRPDLISTHSAKAGWLGRTVGRALRIPTLFTAHGWSFTEGVPAMQRRVYIGVERLTATLATRVITVSDYDRNLALEHRIAPADKIVTVHNGVHDVDPAHRATHGAMGAPVRLITVARFEAQKDHLLLIRSLASLRARAWELTIVGDGPLMAASKALAAELGVLDRIHFLGLRKNVGELLAASDAFVLVTNWEGFPRSILEAMRAGLPVISSSVGGVAESVKEGVTGYLVPRGDQPALTDRLARVMDRPDLRAELGANGRARYEAEFTFERLLANTQAVYRDVLGVRAA
ncbi:MAG: glycosyltransferase family 4 protein [Deltaproteobacteria bacterium]|nr:glycosyltransferase family 4 protein [Deltaproteobacteria bacterium]